MARAVVLFALLLGFLQGVYGQYGYAGPIDSLMAWYKLNDAVTATTAADSGFWGYTSGTVPSGVWFSAANVRFTGVSSGIPLPSTLGTFDLLNSRNFTYSMFIYPEAVAADARLFMASTGSSAIQLSANATGISLTIKIAGGASDVVRFARTFTLNRWYHLAVSYARDATRQYRMYIDGSLVTTKGPATCEPPDVGIGQSTALYLARSSISNTDHFIGRMADVRFFSRRLSDAEVAIVAGGTAAPTIRPTRVPTLSPTRAPSFSPTAITTKSPTARPSVAPSRRPTTPTQEPTIEQDDSSISSPTISSSAAPTLAPTSAQAPTTRPTNAPSRRPTTIPSARPTLAPASSIVFLSPTSTMRSLPSSYSVANADAAVIVRASTADGTCLTGAAISWSSPNETVNDAADSITSAYLKLPVGSLRGGGVYVLHLSATGFTSSQVLIYSNTAPLGGSVGVTPWSGTALLTNFTLTSSQWADVESNLPLEYAFYILKDTRSQIRSTVTLRGLATAATYKTTLPEGSEMTVQGEVCDSLGACSTEEAATLVTATQIAASEAVNLLEGLVARNLSRGGLSQSEIQRAVFISSGLTAVSLQTDNATLGSSIRSMVLEVMGDLVKGANGMTLGQAELLMGSVSLLANASVLAPAQQTQALGLVLAAVGAIEETSTQLNGYALGAVSGLVGDGILQREDCAASRVDKRVDQVMDSLAGLAVGQLTPMDEGFSYHDKRVGMAVKVGDAYSTTGMTVQLAGGSSVSLPSATLAELRGRLCASEVGVSGTSYAENKYTCLQSKALGPSAHSANFTDPSQLLNRLPAAVPVSGFTVKSTCNHSAVRVYGLSSPLQIRLPFKDEPRQGSIQCRKGVRRTVNITCPASPLQAASGNSTIVLSCDGVSKGQKHYKCPPIPPACVFWNETGLSWDTQGCTLASVGTDHVICECNHLTEFAAFPFGSFFLDTLAEYDSLIDDEYLRRNLGVVFAVGALYASFLAALVLLRLRRTRDSMAYMKVADQTRFYRAILKYLSHIQSGKGMLTRGLIAPAKAEEGENSSSQAAEDKDGSGSWLDELERANVRKVLQLANAGDKGENRIAMIDDVLQYRLVKLSVMGRATQGGCLSFLSREGRMKRSRVAAEEVTDKAGTDNSIQLGARSWRRDSLKQPITKLSAQQGLLLLFVKVLIMMTVAIVLGGDPRNTTYIWTYFKDVSSFQSLLNREVMLALLVQSFQQSIVTEPIGRMIEGLLFLVNKETSVKATVSEDIVSRDIDFMPVRSRARLGMLYVPILRLSIIQLEITRGVLLDKYMSAVRAYKIGHSVTPPDMHHLRTVDRVIPAFRDSLEEEYHRQLMERQLDLQNEIERANNQRTRRILQARAALESRKRLPGFVTNPLEPFDVQSRISRVYDDWVVHELLYRPFSDYVQRAFYRLFIAPVHSHVVGQDFFLFSWTLVMVDLVIVVLLLVVSLFLLLIGSSLTTATVVNTFINFVLGAVTSYLVVTPATAFCQSLLTRSVVMNLTERIKKDRGEFITYYNVLVEDEMVAQEAAVQEDPDFPTPMPSGSNPLLATVSSTRRSRVAPEDPARTKRMALQKEILKGPAAEAEGEGKRRDKREERAKAPKERRDVGAKQGSKGKRNRHKRGGSTRL